MATKAKKNESGNTTKPPVQKNPTTPQQTVQKSIIVSKPTERTIVTGKIEIRATLSQMGEKNKNDKKRGPGQIGQQKSNATILISSVGQKEITARIKKAIEYIKTGKF